MAHSNQVREFVMTDNGLTLVDVSRRTDGTVAIGSARGAQEPPTPAGGPEARRRRGVK
jgi:hypothetical protein